MIDLFLELEERINKLNISQDAYDAWKQHDVTKRFMLDVQQQLLESALCRIDGASIEELAKAAIKRNEEKDCLEDVLDWKPQELIHEH